MLPPAILIGYCAKKVEKRHTLTHIKTQNVAEVCSISSCINSQPEGWFEYHPSRNTMWLYRNETDALDRIFAPENLDDFTLFAYKIIPIVFGDEGEQLAFDEEEKTTVSAASENVDPLTSNYDFLGYDCACNDTSWMYSGFQCSPLSCNAMADEIETNRHCLVDDLDRALTIASQFGREQPSPGPYYVIEVWRKRRVPA
jgi:hypothetical protein